MPNYIPPTIVMMTTPKQLKRCEELLKEDWFYLNYYDKTVRMHRLAAGSDARRCEVYIDGSGIMLSSDGELVGELDPIPESYPKILFNMVDRTMGQARQVSA